MTIVDRTKAPIFNTIDNVDFIRADERKLASGIPVYIVNAGEQDLIRIEFVFDAGIKYQSKPLLASSVANNVFEGTVKYSAQQIAEKLDYFGAFFETEVNQDTATVTLYTLNKHLSNTLSFFYETFSSAIFPKEELDLYLQNKKSKYLVSSKKVNSVARKKFNELLFGEKHPLGYYVQLEDYDAISVADLKSFFDKYYTASNCKIIVSGKVPTTIIDLLNTCLGDLKSNSSIQPFTIHAIQSTQQKINCIVKDDAIQSAIRIGRVLFNRTHPDFVPMLVVNTILGGYFGSRLMSNIREDKGYTYGIGSGLVSMKDLGYFFISTEVGVDVCASAINEIYFELDKLCTDLVADSELELVKNYMLGVFLRTIDGPFALADKFKNINDYNLTYDYYTHYVNTVKNITANQIRDLANKYLAKQNMIELVVGKK
ncbi:MAG: insulinase family protein [Bacteroidetes bacterium]|nr:insulinase family protein [Bacteroidota bacterium]